MEDGGIGNHQIKTSPAINGRHDIARLNSIDDFIAHPVWSPFIQVDFGAARKRVTAIAAQVGNRGQNTWTFYVKYTDNGVEWFNYTENGILRVSYPLGSKRFCCFSAQRR